MMSAGSCTTHACGIASLLAALKHPTLILPTSDPIIGTHGNGNASLLTIVLPALTVEVSIPRALQPASRVDASTHLT